MSAKHLSSRDKENRILKLLGNKKLNKMSDKLPNTEDVLHFIKYIKEHLLKRGEKKEITANDLQE